MTEDEELMVPAKSKVVDSNYLAELEKNTERYNRLLVISGVKRDILGFVDSLQDKAKAYDELLKAEIRYHTAMVQAVAERDAARLELEELRDILLDVVDQSCGEREISSGPDHFDNRCISAYERAFDYLVKTGVFQWRGPTTVGRIAVKTKK